MAKVAPSILSADFANMGQDVSKLQTWGASLVHCDVMDGVFVPNMSFGPQMVKAIKKHTPLALDVHLMITKPERYVEEFAKAGADIITVHQEASTHIHRTLKLITSCGVKAGIALNPGTSLSALDYLLDDVNMVLLMTVNPGFGGQSLIPTMIDKVKTLKKMIQSSGKSIDIEVDGGINAENASLLAEAGADILVAGSAVFNADDPKQAMLKMAGKR